MYGILLSVETLLIKTRRELKGIQNALKITGATTAVIIKNNQEDKLDGIDLPRGYSRLTIQPTPFYKLSNLSQP